MDPRWRALLVLTLARGAMGFQFQAPAAAAPLLVDTLSPGYSTIGLLIGLYMLPGVALAFPAGVFGARFGDRRLVTIGLVLMAGGGVLMGLADSYAALIAGRLASGVGAVLLNVLMTKMITDWFAGREIVLAMAVFMNAFPIGIGLALLSLSWLGESAGWQATFYATAVVAAGALLLLLLSYRSHANDGAAVARTEAPVRLITQREGLLVCLAGAIWGLYNGAFTIALGFAPLFLVSEGSTVQDAGFLVALTTWLIVASVQAGGMLVQRWGRADVVLIGAVVASGVCLILLPSVEPAPILVLTGLVLGLPVSVIVSLPAAVLRPEVRAVGMGMFFTGLYLGHSTLPPVAGWLQDATDSATASLYFAGVLLLSIVPIYALFRSWQCRKESQTAPAAPEYPRDR